MARSRRASSRTRGNNKTKAAAATTADDNDNNNNAPTAIKSEDTTTTTSNNNATTSAYQATPSDWKNTWGQVRASPYGSCLVQTNHAAAAAAAAAATADATTTTTASINTVREAQEWHAWRHEHFHPLQFPVDGFDHVYGQATIDKIDQHPLGSSSNTNNNDKNNDIDPTNNVSEHDYGSTKMPGMYVVAHE